MPLHVLHVGVGDGVEHLRRAKADGVDVTAETCTHYLTFTDRDARRCGAVMKTYPLIRTAADRQAVWQGLADGTLDWVCSDHAPHTCEEKHRSFWDAPAGISGIEGLSPVLLTAVHRGLLTLPRVAAITSANAARTFGLYPRKGVIRPGADADLAIVDMSAAYTFRQEKMYSKPNGLPMTVCPSRAGWSRPSSVAAPLCVTVRSCPTASASSCRSAPNSLFSSFTPFPPPCTERLPGARPGAVWLFPYKRDRCMVAPFAVWQPPYWFGMFGTKRCG